MKAGAAGPVRLPGRSRARQLADPYTAIPPPATTTEELATAARERRGPSAVLQRSRTGDDHEKAPAGRPSPPASICRNAAAVAAALRGADVNRLGGSERSGRSVDIPLSRSHSAKESSGSSERSGAAPASDGRRAAATGQRLTGLTRSAAARSVVASHSAGLGRSAPAAASASASVVRSAKRERLRRVLRPAKSRTAARHASRRPLAAPSAATPLPPPVLRTAPAAPRMTRSASPRSPVALPHSVQQADHRLAPCRRSCCRQRRRRRQLQ
jgi:hypothetical protein